MNKPIIRNATQKKRISQQRHRSNIACAALACRDGRHQIRQCLAERLRHALAEPLRRAWIKLRAEDIALPFALLTIALAFVEAIG